MDNKTILKYINDFVTKRLRKIDCNKYEVQSEIVDHLASALEEKYSFNNIDEVEEAIKKEYQLFGGDGETCRIHDHYKRNMRAFCNWKSKRQWLQLIPIAAIALSCYLIGIWEFGRPVIDEIVVYISTSFFMISVIGMCIIWLVTGRSFFVDNLFLNHIFLSYFFLTSDLRHDPVVGAPSAIFIAAIVIMLWKDAFTHDRQYLQLSFLKG